MSVFTLKHCSTGSVAASTRKTPAVPGSRWVADGSRADSARARLPKAAFTMVKASGIVIDACTSICDKNKASAIPRSTAGSACPCAP